MTSNVGDWCSLELIFVQAVARGNQARRMVAKLVLANMLAEGIARKAELQKAK